MHHSFFVDIRRTCGRVTEVDTHMDTQEQLKALDERTGADISALLSRGNVTLQSGGVYTDEDFDFMLEEALSGELGEY